MTGIDILFYILMGLAAGAALAILFSKNVFKSALYLLVTLLALAGLYVLGYAEFVAVAQILVYAGGILVIILFGIMLTSKISGHALAVGHRHIASGAAVGLGLFFLLARYVKPSSDPNNLVPENTGDIGLTLFSEYSLPFEIAGLLLLIALVGAAVVTAHLKPKA
ncbi:MAG TPA: NADH-quinone oxidoreductase subunit J [Chryseosolibacter sp.]